MYDLYNHEYRSRKNSITLSVKTLIAICVLCGFIGGGLSFAGFNMLKPGSNTNTFLGASADPTSSPTQNSNNITNISVESVTSYANAVAKKVLPSIVGINVTTKVINRGWFGDTVTEKVGEGSGIIYKKEGYIITNYHVIQDSITTAGEMNPDSQIKVYLYEDPETGIDARVIGYDIASDLAVIKIDRENLTAIEIGDSDKIEVGDNVLALGNPGGLKFMGSVSQGIISGLNRSIEVDGVYKDLTLIQTDAAINPGNSGGALVDVQGKLIGVNSVKLAASGYEGMGFAIPVNDVVRIVDKLLEEGNAVYTYLGITEDTRYTAELLEKNGYPGGIVVGSVATGSPAEKAGIKSYDIIVEFNGTSVRSMQELQELKNNYKKGDVVKIKVFRQTTLFRGDYITFEVTLA